MSLSKIAEMLGLPDLAELEKQITDKFPTQFGRYESVSGKVYFEIWEGDKGRVGWRKGEGEKVLESEELEYPVAIQRFSEVMNKGYLKVFSARTLAELEEERSKMDANKSVLAKTNRLGTYHKGNDFMRVSEFVKGEYFVEYGTHQSVFDSLSRLDESEALVHIDSVLADGYVKEGSQPTRSNASLFFNDDPKPTSSVKEVSWDMLDDFFD